jgi:hypothetical protein
VLTFTIATKAAKRSSEEKTRRQRDDVNVEVRDRFVIIGIAGGVESWLWTETERWSLRKALRFVKRFPATLILWDSPGKRHCLRYRLFWTRNQSQLGQKITELLLLPNCQ